MPKYSAKRAEERGHIVEAYRAMLKQVRVERGLTQEQYAPIIGVTTQTINRWERGVTPIPMHVYLYLSMEHDNFIKNEHKIIKRDNSEQLPATKTE